MLTVEPTPLIRLGNLFPNRQVYAKCEFLAPSGCFKIRGAMHLLLRLQKEGRNPPLVVPSMGNTALGAATAAKAIGFKMTGVVPKTISRAKDEKLQALGVELVKIDGKGSDLLRHATELAKERNGYFVHPHLDPLWTDGYQAIAEEILQGLPECRSLVFPLGGGGLLMGLLASLVKRTESAKIPIEICDSQGKVLAVFAERRFPRLFACEPFNYPKYATFSHARSTTMADGLLLETPHPAVQQATSEAGITVSLVQESDIAKALRDVYATQGLVIEPSSAISLAFVKSQGTKLEEPICVVLTGENIARDDHRRIIAPS